MEKDKELVEDMSKENKELEVVKQLIKFKEETYTIRQVLQIANVPKHDRLYYEKHYGSQGGKTLVDWKKLTNLTF